MTIGSRLGSWRHGVGGLLLPNPAIIGGRGSFYDYYVNPSTGSDSNSGRSPNQAFASFVNVPTHAVRVGVECGTACVASGFQPASGTFIGPHGSGAAPIIKNSVTHKSGSWTNVSGNIWSAPTSSTYAGTLIWWDSTGGLATEGSVTALTKGTAGSLTANQWAISSGNLQVNIGRQPVISDFIEVPNISSIFTVNADNVRLSGLHLAYAALSLIEHASTTSTRNFHLDNCEMHSADSTGSAYCLHQGHGGAANNFLVEYCIMRDQYNNQGAFANHADTSVGGGSGTVRNCRISRIAGLALTSHDTVSILYDHNAIDGGKIAVIGGGSGSPGTITHQFMTMINAPPNAGAGDFTIQVYDGASACNEATAINFYNSTIVAGTMPTQFRMSKDGSGTTTWKNVLAYGFWSLGYNGSTKANGTITTSNCAGATFGNMNYFFNGPLPLAARSTLQGPGDVNLSADPFIDLAGGDLRLDPVDGAALIGKGVAIPGVTGVAPNIGAL